jgi:perosamine synthetase
VPEGCVIPQIQPWIDREEVDAVRKAVETTFVTEHALTRAFELRLCELTGAKHAVAYANASCALFALLRALRVGPGDEVVVPDLTFVATANAVILAGATPVFCDVDPATMMLAPQLVEPRITPRTRALIPVHLYGMPCDVAALLPLARQHNLAIIEDAAQGVGVRFHGRHVGTGGRAGVLSFYGNKTITTGEGGAILTDDESLARAVYRLKNHGRNEKGVFVHDEIGFNFSFTEMQAGLGLAQLGRLPRIIAEKSRIRRHYERRLAGAPGVAFPPPPAGSEPVYWFTNILSPKVEAIAAALRDAAIASRRFFYPLHLQPCYRDFASPACTNSRTLYETGLSLPSSSTIDTASLDRVCDVVLRASEKP